MRKYAEVYQGFVVDNRLERSDKRVPEFESPRIAVRIDNLPSEPSIGDEHFGGTNFGAPTRPNPNLVRRETDREILEEIKETVNKILLGLPGPP